MQTLSWQSAKQAPSAPQAQATNALNKSDEAPSHGLSRSDASAQPHVWQAASTSQSGPPPAPAASPPAPPVPGSSVPPTPGAAPVPWPPTFVPPPSAAAPPLPVVAGPLVDDSLSPQAKIRSESTPKPKVR